MAKITKTGYFLGDLVQLLTNNVALTNELRTDHATEKTLLTDLKTLVNNIRTAFTADEVITSPALAIGVDVSAVAWGDFTYMINGVEYDRCGCTKGLDPAAEAIPQAKYGLWRYEVGLDGVVAVAGAAANTTGYATEALAIAALPACTADHALMGYVTVVKSDGVFTGATTALNAANVTAAYYNGATSISAAVSSSAPATVSSAAISLTI